MRTVSAAKAREDFSDLIADAGYKQERTIVSKNGKEVAAIVSMDDLNALRELENSVDLEIARRGIAEIKKGAAVPYKGRRK